jgi:hypothetical protein
MTYTLPTLLQYTDPGLASLNLSEYSGAINDLDSRVAALTKVPVTLTDASTVAVDASLGNLQRLTLTASGHAMGAPANPTDGQHLTFEITSGGAFTFTWNAVFVWGSTITVPTLSQTTGKVDVIEFLFNATAAKWRGIRVALGY